MKFKRNTSWVDVSKVAPFTGAWIEIDVSVFYFNVWEVAPFTGAWIEITISIAFLPPRMSLPSRERGLKYGRRRDLEKGHKSLPSRERGLKFGNRRTI